MHEEVATMKRTWLYAVLAVFFSLPLTYATHPPVTLDDNLLWTNPIKASNGDNQSINEDNGNAVASLNSPALTTKAFTAYEGTWAATASMSTPRMEHTATLLAKTTNTAAKGKVLIVGGMDKTKPNLVDQYLKTAVLYNPANGTWANTGSLTQARTRHTATELNDGRVLVTGGLYYSTTNQVANTAAIYNPATGLWTTTGSMGTARYWHTATLLNDGKVLVVGGSNDTNNSANSINSAEVFDPAKNTWANVAAMATARAYHTATLLNTGKVLVTGGQNSANGTLADALVYDPTSNTWSSVGVMSNARVFHSATMLNDGKILITGGSKSLDVSLPLQNELYNPFSTGTVYWSVPTAKLLSGRYSHTATMLYTGKILVAGGVSNATFGVELHDPIFGTTWKQTPPMSSVRYAHTATLLLTGKVLVTGGYYYDSTNHYLSSAELYTPYPTGPIVSPANGGCSTGPAMPNITTLSAQEITSAGAKLYAEVNDNCADSYVSMDLGYTATNYGIPGVTVGSLKITAGSGTKTVYLDTTGLLKCNTLYHYRGKAWNSVSWNGADTNYGVDKTFKTGSCTHTDLRVTVDDKRTLLSRGDSYSYTVIVKNAGTISDANNAIFKAPAVAGLKINGITCSPTSVGAVCPPTANVANLQGTGIILANFVKNSSLTFTINAEVLTTAALGNLIYKATIATPDGVTEDLPTDNSASDIDRVVNRPDFVVSDITMTPNSPLASQTPFTAAVTVKNQGTAGGNAGTLGLWVNKAAGTIACKTATDSQQTAGVIATGASKSFNFSGLNSGLAGSKTLSAFIDSNCLTVESSENKNNQLGISYTVTSIPPPTPELLIDSITLTPASPTHGTNFNVAIVVKNVGSAASDVAFVDVWANSAKAPTTCGASGSTVWKDVPALAASATTTVTLTVPKGVNATTGSKMLQVYIDSWCEITEANEANNKSSKEYTVQ